MSVKPYDFFYNRWQVSAEMWAKIVLNIYVFDYKCSFGSYFSPIVEQRWLKSSTSRVKSPFRAIIFCSRYKFYNFLPSLPYFSAQVNVRCKIVSPVSVIDTKHIDFHICLIFNNFCCTQFPSCATKTEFCAPYSNKDDVTECFCFQKLFSMNYLFYFALQSAAN